MAKGKSAAKAHRRSEKRRVRNQSVRSTAKTFIRAAERLITAGQTGDAQQAVVRAVSQLDRAAEKKILHKNNAARRKSRLMAKLNRALQGAAAARA
ncbi:MAG: 30S ribosomal protein S20 [Chloroflexi bacterium]|nr:30S ribosomal protein S20 [Chloroflexota bacterium]